MHLKAIGQFKKYHPLKMTISYTNPYQTTALLKAFLDIHHAEELNDIANWLLFLGTDIKIREIPREVVKELQGRVKVLGFD